MKKICIIAVLMLFLCSLCIMPISAEENDESWKQYFFLPENGQEINMLINIADKYDELGCEGLEEYIGYYWFRGRDIELRWSEAYTVYVDGGYTGSDPMDYTYNDIPRYFDLRYIYIPFYSGDEFEGVAYFRILSDNVNGKTYRFAYVIHAFPTLPYTTPMWEEDYTEGPPYYVDNDYTRVEKAYNTVKSLGVQIKGIYALSKGGDVFGDDKYIITVEADCRGYVYNYTTDRLYTFDEYIKSAVTTPQPTPTSTPAPTPTPTVTRTPFQPMTTTPTVTPRPSGTGIAPRPTVSAGFGTETAAVSPTVSPTVPGPKKAELTWLIPVVVLCCAAAGGIVWAAISARKKKAGK